MNPLTARIGNNPYLWNKGTLVYIGPTCSKFTSVINHILLFILLLICASERCYMGGRMWAVPHIHSYLNDSLYKRVTNSHQLCSHGTNAGVSTLILMLNRFSKKQHPKHTLFWARWLLQTRRVHSNATIPESRPLHTWYGESILGHANLVHT
jgi:hypothetical protein